MGEVSNRIDMPRDLVSVSLRFSPELLRLCMDSWIALYSPSEGLSLP
jgi:hypothetical protein